MIDYLIRGDYVEIPLFFEGLLQEDPPIYEPIDITGSSIFFTGKRFYEQDDTDADIQVEADITDGANGQAVLVFMPAATANLIPGDMYYDMQITDVNGRPVTIVRGVTVVLADVTRRTI